MPFEQSDLATLDKAIKAGVRRVRYADGTEREYQGMKDMLAARRLIVSEIATASGTAPRRPRIFRLFQSGRGL